MAIMAATAVTAFWAAAWHRHAGGHAPATPDKSQPDGETRLHRNAITVGSEFPQSGPVRTRPPESLAWPEAGIEEGKSTSAGASEAAITNLCAFYREHTRIASRVYALIRRADGAAELVAVLTINDRALAERARRALDGELHNPPGPARPTEIRHITRQLPEPSNVIFTLALHHARNRTWPTPERPPSSEATEPVR